MMNKTAKSQQTATSTKMSKKDLIFIVSLVWLAINAVTVLYLTFRGFRYPAVQSLSSLLIFSAIILLPLAVAIPFKIFWSKMTTGIKMIILFVLFLTLAASTVCAFLFVYASPIKSVTDNPENYLQVESAGYQYKDKMLGVFPEEVPKNAENIKYHYNYSDCVSESVDAFAQWTLAEKEYAREKILVLSSYPKAVIQDKDGFSRVYIKDSFNFNSYEYLIFEYNDTTRTVRYAYSYAADTVDGTYEPYFRSVGA